jgi:hypothetical protein
MAAYCSLHPLRWGVGPAAAPTLRLPYVPLPPFPPTPDPVHPSRLSPESGPVPAQNLFSSSPACPAPSLTSQTNVPADVGAPNPILAPSPGSPPDPAPVPSVGLPGQQGPAPQSQSFASPGFPYWGFRSPPSPARGWFSPRALRSEPATQGLGPAFSGSNRPRLASVCQPRAFFDLSPAC